MRPGLSEKTHGQLVKRGTRGDQAGRVHAQVGTDGQAGGSEGGDSVDGGWGSLLDRRLGVGVAAAAAVSVECGAISCSQGAGRFLRKEGTSTCAIFALHVCMSAVWEQDSNMKTAGLSKAIN